MSEPQISDLIYRIRHEVARRWNGDAFPIKALRIGDRQYTDLLAGVCALSRHPVESGSDRGVYAGVPFYRDHGFDGVEIEFIEETAAGYVARAVAAALTLPCRAI